MKTFEEHIKELDLEDKRVLQLATRSQHLTTDVKSAVRRIIARLKGLSPEERKREAIQEYEKLCSAHYETCKALDDMHAELERVRGMLADLTRQKMDMEQAIAQAARAKAAAINRWKAEGVDFNQEENVLNARYNYVPRTHPNRHQILQARAAHGIAPPDYDARAEKARYEKIKAEARRLYKESNGELNTVVTELNIPRQLALELCFEGVTKTGNLIKSRLAEEKSSSPKP